MTFDEALAALGVAGKALRVAKKKAAKAEADVTASTVELQTAQSAHLQAFKDYEAALAAPESTVVAAAPAAFK